MAKKKQKREKPGIVNNKKERFDKAKRLYVESAEVPSLPKISQNLEIPKTSLYKKAKNENWEEQREKFWEEANKLKTNNNLEIAAENLKESEERHLKDTLYIQKEVMGNLKSEQDIKEVECAKGGFYINKTFERLKCLKIGWEIMDKAIDKERKIKKMDAEAPKDLQTPQNQEPTGFRIVPWTPPE